MDKPCPHCENLEAILVTKHSAFTRAIDRLELENRKLREQMDNADRTIDTTNLINAKKENHVSENKPNSDREFWLKVIRTILAVLGAIVAYLDGKGTYKEGVQELALALRQQPKMVSPVSQERPTMQANPGLGTLPPRTK